MAVVSKNPTNSIFSFKNLLLYISVVVMTFILKLYVPFVIEVSVLRSWFTPPYLYVVVNIIIIAIAASSRFQQKMEEGVSEMMASAKVQQTNIHKETYDVAGRKNSAEYKTDFGVMQLEMYGHLEVKKKQSTELELNASRKPVDVKPEAYDFEMKPKKKPIETMKARDLEVKIKKKLVEPKIEFEFSKPEKHVHFEAKNLQVNNKMERSAKEGEDHYIGARSEKIPNRMRTIEIPMDYSSDKRKISDRFDHHEQDEETLEAGKEVSAAEGEEGNDTLDGTWKMIMESRRIQEAGLQEASEKVEKFKKSNNALPISFKKERRRHI